MSKGKKEVKEKKPVGRPTDYKPEYCQKMIDFFNVPHIIKVEKEITNPDGSITIKETERPNKLPTFEAFAFSIGHHRETLRNWCESYPEFFAAYKKAQDLQKDMLIYLGMVGLYNPTFTIFTAKNITDMKDKQEIAQTNVNTDATIEELKSYFEQ